MSNIDKQVLREVAERATPGNWRRTSSLFNGITVTPFSLCGEEVTLAHTVEKRDAEFIAAANPATMLQLLDENLQLQRERDAIEAVALALRDDMRQAREQLEAAEKRINDYHTVLNNLAAVARRYLPDYDEHPDIQAADDLLESAAGIGVKQQEDSVDSDVGSRNQPGMVVAVHIGAGDFVKVKGQVFEVEETDFDDHDVTLWFVGGNALKCAAGCPVEVVSAPVAAGIKVKGE